MTMIIAAAALTGCPNSLNKYQIQLVNATSYDGQSVQYVKVGGGVVSAQPDALGDVTFTPGGIFTLKNVPGGDYQFLVLFDAGGGNVKVATFQLSVKADMSVSFVEDQNGDVTPNLDPFLNKDLQVDPLGPIALVN